MAVVKAILRVVEVPALDIRPQLAGVVFGHALQYALHQCAFRRVPGNRFRDVVNDTPGVPDVLFSDS